VFVKGFDAISVEILVLAFSGVVLEIKNARVLS
jgi:hypothetical protein